MADVFLSPGVRTPFVKAGGVYAQQSSLQLSIPVVQKMRERAQPDLLVWGQVIPDPSLSNIARELIFEAGLDPHIPAYSTILACSTSFIATLQAAGLMGRGGMHLALVVRPPPPPPKAGMAPGPKSRLPLPMRTGKTSMRYSSMRSCAIRVCNSPALPCTCNSCA